MVLEVCNKDFFLICIGSNYCLPLSVCVSVYVCVCVCVCGVCVCGVCVCVCGVCVCSVCSSCDNVCVFLFVHMQKHKTNKRKLFTIYKEMLCFSL